MGFSQELKRRTVYKAAVAYGVIAWLLIQAESSLVPRSSPRGRRGKKITPAFTDYVTSELKARGTTGSEASITNKPTRAYGGERRGPLLAQASP